MTALADHYRSADGPPLLLVHGFTATWRAWGPMPALLAEQFDVLAPTAAWHTGGPPLDEDGDPIEGIADGLEAMLDEVGWKRPHVAGWRWAGSSPLELAKRGRARSVCAVCPAGTHGEDFCCRRCARRACGTTTSSDRSSKRIRGRG